MKNSILRKSKFTNNKYLVVPEHILTMSTRKRKDHDKYWIISEISLVLGESINTSHGDDTFAWNVGDTCVTLRMENNEISVTLVDWDYKLSLIQSRALGGIASSYNLEVIEYIIDKKL